MPYTNPIYKTITETVPEFFFVYDLLNKETIFASPRFFDLIKAGPEEKPLHELFREFIHPEHRGDLEQFFNDLSFKNEYSARVELKVNEEISKMEWVKLHTHAIEKEDIEHVTHIVGHILDISERKRRYTQLEEENEKLDSVLKILAHDLRAPFSQVYMLANLIQDQMTAEEQQRFSHYLQMLRNLGQRSLNLLENLLRLTALQEGAKRLESQQIDVREVVHSVAQQNHLELHSRSQLLNVAVPDTAVSLNADKLLLEQALNNLLSNAMKFTPAGGTIWIRLHLPEPNKVVLEVEDTGVGIAEEDVPHLFTEFSRIRRKGLKGEKPVGLGLAICQQIIKLHNGSVKVSSTPGKGTCFTILVPS